jgi:hypothetical protein
MIPQPPRPSMRPSIRSSIVFLALGAAALAACTTSTAATTYTPYTGVDVPTSAVTAGVGCASADSDGGIDHYIAFLAPASDAGTPLDVNPKTLLAAGSFACFTPNGVFENVDASATFDVWIFAFPPGLPSGVPCDAGTCALNAADAWGRIVYDVVDAGEQPTVVLRCTAVAESGAHPAAYGCQRVGAIDAGAD